MKVISADIAVEPVVIAENTQQIIIEIGDARFIIRDYQQTDYGATIVVDLQSHLPGETVRRNTIEPIGHGSFWITQYVIKHDDSR
jgi:hypothetical protein